MATTTLKFSPELTISDNIVLRNLGDDIKRYETRAHLSPKESGDEGYASRDSEERAQDELKEWGVSSRRDLQDIDRLKALNDPGHDDFEPTVVSTWDMADLQSKLPAIVYSGVVLPYIAWARKIARHETDVLMVTHLIIYLSMSVPSALWLYHSFTYVHGVFHLAMQFYFMGAYTLLMHQHIHMNGVLAKTPFLRCIDVLFPYILDPLMGHTWNTYFYHHVKHHHVEGNGPDDLSSTIRYQRDSALHFLHYFVRFFLLIWIELPLYFARKGKWTNAAKAACWELSNYSAIYTMFRINSRATTFVFLCPLLLLRIGLMVGNWGQHAFVDADEPASDFRSSITLIDVPSNRYCYNDGYHTSHHLNPRRHWRDHPVAFLQRKDTYIREKALVFHDIDYLFITVRLLMKDYMYLAKCLVPLGDQAGMTLEERATMLRRHTRKFSEEEIREKFGIGKSK